MRFQSDKIVDLTKILNILPIFRSLFQSLLPAHHGVREQNVIAHDGKYMCFLLGCLRSVLYILWLSVVNIFIEAEVCMHFSGLDPFHGWECATWNGYILPRSLWIICTHISTYSDLVRLCIFKTHFLNEREMRIRKRKNVLDRRSRCSIYSNKIYPHFE